MEWIKSSFSYANGNCVQLAALPDGTIALRDSKDNGEGPVLCFTRAELAAFFDGVTAGEFDHFASA